MKNLIVTILLMNLCSCAALKIGKKDNFKVEPVVVNFKPVVPKQSYIVFDKTSGQAGYNTMLALEKEIKSDGVFKTFKYKTREQVSRDVQRKYGKNSLIGKFAGEWRRYQASIPNKKNVYKMSIKNSHDYELNNCSIKYQSGKREIRSCEKYTITSTVQLRDYKGKLVKEHKTSPVEKKETIIGRLMIGQSTPLTPNSSSIVGGKLSKEIFTEFFGLRVAVMLPWFHSPETKGVLGYITSSGRAGGCVEDLKKLREIKGSQNNQNRKEIFRFYYNMASCEYLSGNIKEGERYWDISIGKISENGRILSKEERDKILRDTFLQDKSLFSKNKSYAREIGIFKRMMERRGSK